MPKGVYPHKKGRKIPGNGKYDHYKIRGSHGKGIGMNPNSRKGSPFVKGHPQYFDAKNMSRGFGEDNHMWKGDNAGKYAMHKWVYKWKGKANHCEDCGLADPRRTYNWSNIDHKYRRVLEDYISRCIPCHRKYDIILKGTIRRKQKPHD